MTWIELADTAVKIGLGALIAGGFGYLTARHNHRNEATKELVKARRELLAKTVTILNDFNKAFAALKAATEERADRLANEEKESTQEAKAFEALYEQYSIGFSSLIDAEAYLLLIGETTIRDTVLSYIDMLDSVSNAYYWQNQSLDVTAISTFNRKLREIRKDILLQIGVAYTKSK